MTIRYINSSNFAFPPTDKDGGFCMVLKPSLQSTLLRAMDGDNYRLLSRNSDRAAEGP